MSSHKQISLKVSARWMPEHDKLKREQEERGATSQALGDFLAWLMRRYEICLGPHEHTGDCGARVMRNDPILREYRECGLREGQLVQAGLRVEKVLAEYLGVDAQKLDDEKRALLESLRGEE